MPTASLGGCREDSAVPWRAPVEQKTRKKSLTMGKGHRAVPCSSSNLIMVKWGSPARTVDAAVQNRCNGINLSALLLCRYVTTKRTVQLIERGLLEAASNEGSYLSRPCDDNDVVISVITGFWQFWFINNRGCDLRGFDIVGLKLQVWPNVYSGQST